MFSRLKLEREPPPWTQQSTTALSARSPERDEVHQTNTTACLPALYPVVRYYEITTGLEKRRIVPAGHDVDPCTWRQLGDLPHCKYGVRVYSSCISDSAASRCQLPSGVLGAASVRDRDAARWLLYIIHPVPLLGLSIVFRVQTTYGTQWGAMGLAHACNILTFPAPNNLA